MALFAFLRRLTSVVYLMTHPDVPLRLKTLPVLALAYVIFPRDLLPDFRPFGFIDDVIVVTVLLGIFTSRGWYHIERAKKGGFHSVIAGMTEGNPASEALHGRFGFVEAGRNREVGYKFERWLDVVWMQLMLPPAE